ncbi:HlyD family secretion protein [Mucilaginibacter frigoritolerans]|jgi:multidrug efflux pump subunit AcrA (membrane-fusion protein)|uniref:HlyD family secretion protein n=1 Tax=Mucilaginibacter frigoritolerans TaxID=652788 RepID=A0A562U6V4_9SPHI|nr:HlyD family efflux transporter periplasmic adaptor subunit [Mucilaginibacter frigoritolerans]TWJ01532.1 HlyD family secretion protein [Mucilaginibacter frigoritolerans]
MPSIYNYDNETARHTEDMQDIITAVPSWVLRYGITMFFGVLVLIIGLSAFIRYPDIVKAQLKVDSPNSPKPVVSKISGKLVKLLVAENEMVKTGQPLGYLESTANHTKVLALLTNLKTMQSEVLQNKTLGTALFNQADNLQFGELQSAYQVFFQEYLAYKSSVENGFLLKKKTYLQKDLANLAQQQQQLEVEKSIEQRDFNLASDEYEMHKKLTQQKVETLAELRQEESKYLAKKTPLAQTESALITGANNYTAKQGEILELDNQVQEEKGKFLQALNSLISTAEDWKSRYVLVASQSGKLSFAGIIQENQVLTPNQEVFYINPGNEAFFGEMAISQGNMGKVKEGQQVLVKLRSYPFEEYGMIRGRIRYISDIPFKDSVFISKVDFKIKNTSDLKKPIILKQGMMADAEIITQDATILQRLTRDFFKIISNK